MEIINRGNKTKHIFLYRDATQGNFANKIWINLVDINNSIEKKLDSSIGSNFKIIIT